MASDSPNSVQQSAEEEIERLAQEIGRLIRKAEPKRQEDLKELTYTLIREEIIQRDEEEQKGEGSPPGPFNPLGVGVLFFVLGGGLFIIFPAVGLLLMLGGIFFVLLGALLSWFK